jgi:hypothetical protein
MDTLPRPRERAHSTHTYSKRFSTVGWVDGTRSLLFCSLLSHRLRCHEVPCLGGFGPTQDGLRNSYNSRAMEDQQLDPAFLGDAVAKEHFQFEGVGNTIAQRGVLR